MSESSAIIIWMITDGKAGHENQSEGLIAALSEKLTIEVYRLQALDFKAILRSILYRKNKIFDHFPKPDIVMGAGHKTHFSLMLLRWLYKAQSVVLMKPSLPLRWFDLCLIPEHDGKIQSDHVINTVGVLNRVRVKANKNLNQGVILIGGPSKHYDWDESLLFEQLMRIFQDSGKVKWLVSDSRRTPESTRQRLSEIAQLNEQVDFVSWQSVSSDWLPDILSSSMYCWVTQESVSMVYEALTAQLKVGLLSVPEIKFNRVSEGVKQLIKNCYAVTFDQWIEEGGFPELKIFKNESIRCAHVMIERWSLK